MMGGLSPQGTGMMGGLSPQGTGMMGGLSPQGTGTVSCTVSSPSCTVSSPSPHARLHPPPLPPSPAPNSRYARPPLPPSLTSLLTNISQQSSHLSNSLAAAKASGAPLPRQAPAGTPAARTPADLPPAATAATAANGRPPEQQQQQQHVGVLPAAGGSGGGATATYRYRASGTEAGRLGVRGADVLPGDGDAEHLGPSGAGGYSPQAHAHARAHGGLPSPSGAAAHRPVADPVFLSNESQTLEDNTFEIQIPSGRSPRGCVSKSTSVSGAPWGQQPVPPPDALPPGLTRRPSLERERERLMALSKGGEARPKAQEPGAAGCSRQQQHAGGDEPVTYEAAAAGGAAGGGRRSAAAVPEPEDAAEDGYFPGQGEGRAGVVGVFARRPPSVIEPGADDYYFPNPRPMSMSEPGGACYAMPPTLLARSGEDATTSQLATRYSCTAIPTSGTMGEEGEDAGRGVDEEGDVPYSPLCTHLVRALEEAGALAEAQEAEEDGGRSPWGVEGGAGGALSPMIRRYLYGDLGRAAPAARAAVAAVAGAGRGPRVKGDASWKAPGRRSR